MITLYGIQSTHVARVRAALIKKGLDFQHVSVNLKNKSEEFMKLNPNGKIPVLEDSDGTIVIESANIMLYLDQKYPETYQMFSKDSEKNAVILNVIGIMDAIMNMSFPLAVEKFGLAEAYTNAGFSHRALTYTDKQKEDLKKDFAQKLDKLYRVLNGKEYFTGTYSAADAVMISGLRTLGYFEIDTSKWQSYVDNAMKQDEIAQMFAPEDTKAIKEI